MAGHPKTSLNPQALPAVRKPRATPSDIPMPAGA
jgi:hypothetical protein